MVDVGFIFLLPQPPPFTAHRLSSFPTTASHPQVPLPSSWGMWARHACARRRKTQREGGAGEGKREVGSTSRNRATTFVVARVRPSLFAATVGLDEQRSRACWLCSNICFFCPIITCMYLVTNPRRDTSLDKIYVFFFNFGEPWHDGSKNKKNIMNLLSMIQSLRCRFSENDGPRQAQPLRGCLSTVLTPLYKF